MRFFPFYPPLSSANVNYRHSAPTSSAEQGRCSESLSAALTQTLLARMGRRIVYDGAEKVRWLNILLNA
jgi:hypothetical protein